MQKLLLLLLGISLTLCGAGFLYGSDNLELGAPGQAETIIDRDGYALGYSPEHRQAVWVIYKLTAGEVGSRVAGRSNNFRVDPEIHSQQAEPGDYRNSGYDRGHLAPAADMAWSETTMSESFFMSNISPQQPAFLSFRSLRAGFRIRECIPQAERSCVSSLFSSPVLIFFSSLSYPHPIGVHIL